MHKWDQSYVWQLLWTARSNSKTCTQRKMDALHDSLRHREALVGRELSSEIELAVEVEVEPSLYQNY